MGDSCSGMPLGPLSRATAEHCTWDENCDGSHLVEHEALSVTEEQMPPHLAGSGNLDRCRKIAWVLKKGVIERSF